MSHFDSRKVVLFLKRNQFHVVSRLSRLSSTKMSHEIARCTRGRISERKRRNGNSGSSGWNAAFNLVGSGFMKCRRTHLLSDSLRQGVTFRTAWWWWLFPRLRGLGGGGGVGWGEVIHSSPVVFFFFLVSGDQLAHTNSTISPQWLSELRQLWLSVPWQVACEPVSLLGSYTIPGQHNQPAPTSLGKGCTCV